MGLFGPKKTPEEKQKEREELERRIAEAEEAKAKKKSKKAKSKDKKSTATIDENQNEQKESDEVPVSSSGLSAVDLDKIRNRRKTMNTQSREDFVRKISNHKIQERKESQSRKEILSRLSKDDLSKIVRLLNDSKDIYDFYEKGIKEFNPKVFIALDIMSPTEQELFQYIYKNDLSNELYQGDVSLINKAYVQSQKERYQEFVKSNEKMVSSVRSGKDQFYDDRLKHLPKIYVLGNQNDFDLVNAMSIPTVVKPVFDENDLDIFEKDQSEKCVILFKTVNKVLSKDYQRIKKEQKFKILLSFNVSDVKMNNEVVPFNRDNLISKLI